MSGPSRRATIKDIAGELGLSVATVSRVLRGDTHFSERTSELVRRKAAELDYRPNVMARALVSRRGSSLIGLILPNLLSSFYIHIIAGVQEEVEPKGYSIILGNSAQDPADEKRHLRICMEKMVDGIIITPISTLPANAQIFNHVVDGKTPLIMAGNPKAGVRAPWVKVDNAAGGAAVARHLLGLGHRTLAYVTYSRDELQMRGRGMRPDNVERWDGFQGAIAAAQPAARAHLLEAPGLDITDDTVNSLLALKPAPTAIFCYSDMTAIRLIRLLEKRGLDVPTRFSVVGFDDLELAALAKPALTTIAQPKKEMGRLAAAKLIEMIERRQTPSITLQPELVIRDTTAPPAR